MKTILLTFLISCAPTYRIVQEVRHVPRPQTCPTLSMLLGDFTISTIALAISALRYNARDYTGTAVAAGVGMGIGLGDNLAETTCR